MFQWNTFTILISYKVERLTVENQTEKFSFSFKRHLKGN